MLRVTKETDYGILVLTSLAERRVGSVHAARETAERVGLPLPMVSKILRSLARQGLLTSHRGASGGYSLVRPPDQISVAEVVRAIEGPISLVQCGSEPGACEQEHCCPTRMSWSRISVEIERTLERVPISEMMPTRDRPLLGLGSENAPPPA